MIRILLVDDQNLVQQGIKSLLEQDRELQVIATVKDGRTAVKEIEYLRPDVVLLDIEMPGMDGITTAKYINRLSPKTKTIILSSHEDKKYVTQALMAGAKGYLLKNSLMSDLKQAIFAVNNGYSQIDSRLLAKVFDPSNLKPKKPPIDDERVEDTKNKHKHSSDNFISPPTQAPLESFEQNDLEVNFKSSKSDSSPSSYQLGNQTVKPAESKSQSNHSSLKRPDPETSDVPVAESITSEPDTLVQKDADDFDTVELESPQQSNSNSSFLTQQKPRPHTEVQPQFQPQGRERSTQDSEENISDFLSFKDILPNVKSNELENLPTRSLLVDERPKTSTQSRVLPPKENLFNPPAKDRTRATQILPQPVNQSYTVAKPISLTKYQPAIKKESGLKAALRRSLRYSWAWNIGLLIFGAIIVIVIGTI